MAGGVLGGAEGSHPSELLLLSAAGFLHRVLLPAAAAEQPRHATPRHAAPPLSLAPAHHGFVTSLAYADLGGSGGGVGILAVGGGGAPLSKAAALVLAKAEAAAGGGDGPREGRPLPSLSLWAITDEAPHARLLFATTAEPPRASRAAAVAAAPLAALRRARAAASGSGVPHCLALSDGGHQLAALCLIN